MGRYGEWRYRYLRAYVNNFDLGFEKLIKSRGYKIEEDYPRTLSSLTIPRTIS